MRIRNFIVEKSDENHRLDIYLSRKNNDFSRTFIKNTIEQNNVKVNGLVEYRANYKVKFGDKIVIDYNLDHSTELEPQNIPLDIIYEDEDLVAINKTSGMSVHPVKFSDKNTVVNALLYRYKNMKYIGNSIRTGLIHRLDKGTSGVLLIGKTNKGLHYYTKQFADRKVEKYYIAISKSQTDPKRVFRNQELEIQNYLGRNKSNRKKFSVVDSHNGKIAKSKVYYLESKEDYHLFLVRIFTGRTHQIRIHLSGLGFPVLGDDKYKGLKYSRLMLHSAILKIQDINGNDLKLIADQPKEFAEIFKDIDLDSYV